MKTYLVEFRSGEQYWTPGENFSDIAKIVVVFNLDLISVIEVKPENSLVVMQKFTSLFSSLFPLRAEGEVTETAKASTLVDLAVDSLEPTDEELDEKPREGRDYLWQST